MLLAFENEYTKSFTGSISATTVGSLPVVGLLSPTNRQGPQVPGLVASASPDPHHTGGQPTTPGGCPGGTASH